MIQIEPGEKFIIARQIYIPSDTTTYYVRAYIRNAESDTLLDTVDLVDKGDQRFRGTWYVPMDPSGQGFYVTILTKVFTDSGHTTESDTYGRTEEEFLIQQRWNAALGGGGGVDVDYKKVRRKIQEEMKGIKLPETKNITKYNTVQEKVVVDLSPIMKAMDGFGSRIDGIKPAKETDLSPVIKELRGLADRISGIKLPNIDLGPVVERINELSQEVINKNKTIEGAFQTLKGRKFVELKVMQKDKTKIKKRRTFS